MLRYNTKQMLTLITSAINTTCPLSETTGSVMIVIVGGIILWGLASRLWWYGIIRHLDRITRERVQKGGQKDTKNTKREHKLHCLPNVILHSSGIFQITIARKSLPC